MHANIQSTGFVRLLILGGLIVIAAYAAGFLTGHFRANVKTVQESYSQMSTTSEGRNNFWTSGTAISS
jgi:hypothetical protein